MSADYKEILNRIKEERMRLALSQSEMSQFARIDQSDFSKVELGTRRLKYAEIKGLCESPADVYFIFTGKRAPKEYKELFVNCTYDKLVDILNIIIKLLIATKKGDVAACWNGVYVSIEEVCRQGNFRKEHLNAFSIIRRLKHSRQKAVAEELGIDVKKYRCLENGKKLPDSELVWELYNYHGLSPSIILKDKNCLICEIGCTLMELNEQTREKVIEFIKEISILK